MSSPDSQFYPPGILLRAGAGSLQKLIRWGLGDLGADGDPLWRTRSRIALSGRPFLRKPRTIFFKTFQIHRAADAGKNVLVYTVVSTKLINGPPFNSISVVPAGLR